MAAAPKRKYLAFEIDARPLDERLLGLEPGSAEAAEASGELSRCLERITAGLTPWERVQLARHPDRPYALDLTAALLSEFEPLAGDRLFGEDPALIAALARFGGRPVAVLAQQKGRTAEERAHRRFAMARPEGYRKAQRIIALAGRFKLPIVSFVDTPGAHPGIEAEERGQAQAIAETLLSLLEAPVPTVSFILGEGGSGGALALAATDRVLMAEHALYTVISPEGCAAILWKGSEKAPEAAQALRGDAASLMELGIVDEAVSEPPGGAHRDVAAFAHEAGQSLARALAEFDGLSGQELLSRRRTRYREMTAGAVVGDGSPL